MDVRELINKVLVGLRKDQVEDSTTELTEKFHLLVLQTINAAKEDIEACHDWHALRASVTVNVIAGTTDYELTGTTPLSRLLYERTKQGNFPSAFDVTSGSKGRMTEKTREEILGNHALDASSTTNSMVNEFAIYSDGTTLRIVLWPTPSESRTLTIRVVNPQDELELDSLDTELTIPGRPVWMQALCDLIQERGEELQGEASLVKLQSRADNVLIDAIWAERTDDDNTAFVR